MDAGIAVRSNGCRRPQKGMHAFGQVDHEDSSRNVEGDQPRFDGTIATSLHRCLFGWFA